MRNGESNGYLLVRNEQSLLIDCPAAVTDWTIALRATVPGWRVALCATAATRECGPPATAATRECGPPLPNLSLPAIILHTHLQEEHCREWAAFPAAEVYVPADTSDLATLSPQFYADCQTVWPPDREWESRGDEKYGLVGCVTARPPKEPLNVAGELRPGETFRWQDLEFEIIDLRGSDKRAVGLYWREHEILFCGDLLRAGGFVVNFYDLERAYGLTTGHEELRESLKRALALEPKLLLPTTGEPITEPEEDMESLLAGLAGILEEMPCRRAGEEAAMTNYEPVREFGRYRQVMDGVYQNNHGGAIILFVDDEGRGLMIDPDFCVWLTWEENCRLFHEDLDLLEKETGLKRIDRALVTHPHGDHMQYVDLLRARYNTEIVAVHDTARLLARPEDFPYPGLVDWFGFPYRSMEMDRAIAYDQTDYWHQVPVIPIWTPGHCNIHASYLIEWRGVRTLCTGDLLQYGAGPIRAMTPITYSDTAWPERGPQYTYAKMAELAPDLVVSNHSHSFFDRDHSIVRDLCEVYREAYENHRELVHDGDVMRAMTPPGYDDIRLSRDEGI